MQLAATGSWYSNRKKETNRVSLRGGEFCIIGEQTGESQEIR